MSGQEEKLPRPGGEMIRTVKDTSLCLGQALAEIGADQPLNPLIYDTFTDPDFVRNLPEGLRDPNELKKFILNSSKFADADGCFDGWAEIPETAHADGRTRRAEEGSIIDLGKLSEKGIDPNYVLYFRRTQPSEKPKPEHYWTSDYWETYSGLNVEISGRERSNSIILCSTLEDINSDGGLIGDINDDNGVPVRRINQDNYDQRRCLFTIRLEKDQQMAAREEEKAQNVDLAEARNEIEMV